MSKRTRSLILGVTLAAMNLAGLTAVAQAHATEQTITQFASPPLEPHAGESYRHRAVASSITGSPNAIEHAIAQQRSDSFTTDAALRRQLARERSSIPTATPAQAPAPTQADEPNGQPGWLLASLGGLAAALALIAGLVVLAIRRAGRRARVGHAA
jgi:hypothetical protein